MSDLWYQICWNESKMLYKVMENHRCCLSHHMHCSCQSVMNLMGWLHEHMAWYGLSVEASWSVYMSPWELWRRLYGVCLEPYSVCLMLRQINTPHAGLYENIEHVQNFTVLIWMVVDLHGHHAVWAGLQADAVITPLGLHTLRQMLQL